MIESASSIRSAARVALKGHWAEAAMLTFVYLLVSWAFSSIAVAGLDSVCTGLGTLATFLLMPLVWGFSMAFLLNRRGVEDSFGIGNLVFAAPENLTEEQSLIYLSLFSYGSSTPLVSVEQAYCVTEEGDIAEVPYTVHIALAN